MTDHVLVPVDASPLSEQAVEFALEEYADDATITVLHVIDFVEAGYGAPMEASLPGYWEDWYETEKENAEELFANLQSMADDYDVTLATETVMGQPARSIVEFADSEPIDHVVMGSHGRSGVSRILLGSVAETVLRRAHCPVTIVR